MRKSKILPWIKFLVGFMITLSAIGSGIIGLTAKSDYQSVYAIAFLLAGLFFSFILAILGESLEYFEHITTQLDNIYHKEENKKAKHIDIEIK